MAFLFDLTGRQAKVVRLQEVIWEWDDNRHCRIYRHI